jgi:gliotoxin/aspirochlorine/mycotoxins biosynthesis cytochrome P450 monooxygenase
VSQQRWKRVRKPFEGHFTRPASIDRSRSFIHTAREFLADLSGGKACTINAANDLKYCPFLMVASIFFGDLTLEQQKELRLLGPPRELLFRDAFSGGINRYSFAKFLPGSALPQLRDFQRRWELFVRQAYAEAVAKGDGAIVLLWEAMERGEMTMPEVFYLFRATFPY